MLTKCEAPRKRMRGTMKPDSRTFTREATGILREVTPTGAAMFNVNSVNLGYTLFLCLVVLTLPGASLYGSLLLTVLLIIPFLLVYAFFTTIMPRSGGDYVFTSRTLNKAVGWPGPLLGFVGNCSMWIAEVIFLSIQSLWVSSLYISSAFATIGYLADNSVLIDLGQLFTTKETSLAVALLAISLIGVTMIVGMNFHIKFQWAVTAIAMAGTVIAIGTLWLLLLSGGHKAFVNAFNSFASNYMTSSNPYDEILNEVGPAPPFSPLWTLIATGALFTSFGYGYFSTYFAGEIRGANNFRNQVYSMFSPVLCVLVLTFLIIVPLQSVADPVFLGGAQLMSLGILGPWQLPVPPSIYFWMGLMIRNPILNAIVQISGVAWNVLIVAILFPMLTRSIFAWSFDRLLPERFAAVDSKYHSPYVSVIFIAIVAGLLAAIFTYWQEATQLAYLAVYGASGIMIVTAFLFVSISAIVFPHVMKDAYNKSPVAKYNVEGFSLMSLAGIASTVVMLMWAFFYFTVPELAIAADSTAQLIIISVIALAFVIFVLSMLTMRSKGVDFRTVYAEIPPE
jgi:APA family basic amino acid/polyamine antiporter